jgi:type IX secretion system PorP/SprF family membrane protein
MKMKTKNKIVIVILFLFALNEMQAQDPASSQFFFNPLYLNPAFAGTTKGARFGGIYRNQWPNVPSKFVSYNAWGDIYNPLFHGGLGLIAMQDVSGEGMFKTTTIGFVQSYERAIPKVVRLRAGYNITAINKKIDFSRLVFPDQLDPVMGQIYASKANPVVAAGKTFIDFTAGFIADAPNFTIGGSQVTNTVGYVMNHLTEPQQSVIVGNGTLPRKHTLHYTMIVSVKGEGPKEKITYISPNIIWEKQGNFTSSVVGFYVTKAPLIGGLFYRKREFANFRDSDAFIVYLGVKYDFSKTSDVRIGYSYDVTINKLSSNALGAHELSIVFDFKGASMFSKNMKLKRKHKKAMDCEDFGSKSLIF